MRLVWSEGKHSPYVSRRHFSITAEDVTRDDIEALDILKEPDYILDFEPFDFESYTKSFCEKCRESFPCFRHGTAENFINSLFGPPTNERVVELQFEVFDKDEVELKRLRIEFTGWLAEGDREKITIKRPSGVTFTYKNHSPKSTYWFILHWLARELWPLLPYALIS